MTTSEEIRKMIWSGIAPERILLKLNERIDELERIMPRPLSQWSKEERDQLECLGHEAIKR